MLAATLSVLTMMDCSAQRPDGKNNGALQAKRAKFANQASGRFEPQDAQANRGERGPRDRARSVERIMARFDTDGDQKLDATELQVFLAELGQRRQNGNGPAGSQNKNAGKEKKGRKIKGKAGKGGRRGQSADGRSGFQGVAPTRPPAG